MTPSAERQKARLFGRMHAYRAVFMHNGARRRWWHRWTGEPSPFGQTVLEDLARYCYANKTALKVSPMTGQTDPYATAFAEGRRDVFNRIAALLNLTPDQIIRIANHRAENE